MVLICAAGGGEWTTAAVCGSFEYALLTIRRRGEGNYTVRKSRKTPSDDPLPRAQTPALVPGSGLAEPPDTHHEARLQEGRYSEHFEHAPVSLWVEDFSDIKRRLDSLKRNGVEDLRGYFRKYPEEVLALARKVKVVRVNEATLRLFGARGTEEFHEGLSVIFGKESYDVFKEELIAFWKGKPLFRSEATNLTLNGDRIDILLQVTVDPGFQDTWSRVYVAITDVTALKEGIEELRASEDKYRRVFATARAPMMLVDHDSGIVVEVNEGVCRVLGLAKSEIVGRHFAELFSPEGRERAGALLRSCGKERDFSAGSLHAHHGSGRSVPVSATAAYIEVGGVRHVSVCLNVANEDKPPSPKVAGRRALQREILLKRITGREREILRLIVGGHTNRAIAGKLQISEKTVETHRSRMMQKLDIHRLADLVRFAVAAGLTP